MIIPPAHIPAILAGLVLLAAGFCDLRRFEIPDSLSVALVILAAIHGLLVPDFGWLLHLASGLLMFAVGAGLFAKGWMGGGDVKLMAAVAFWATPAQLPLLLADILLAGGLLALLLLLARRLIARAATIPPARLWQMDAPLPYAVAILAGSVFWALGALSF